MAFAANSKIWYAYIPAIQQKYLSFFVLFAVLAIARLVVSFCQEGFSFHSMHAYLFSALFVSHFNNGVIIVKWVNVLLCHREMVAKLCEFWAIFFGLCTNYNPLGMCLLRFKHRQSLKLTSSFVHWLTHGNSKLQASEFNRDNSACMYIYTFEWLVRTIKSQSGK